ncbi:unnamed protein product [Durusdinium trenchii]|uniref:Anticodon-binding domain-containing protein n=1 Tax=Durusdinium trenchii TaxID=1381693 RepID=A0ABP0I9Z0_9DINO
MVKRKKPRLNEDEALQVEKPKKHVVKDSSKKKKKKKKNTKAPEPAEEVEKPVRAKTKRKNTESPVEADSKTVKDTPKKKRKLEESKVVEEVVGEASQDVDTDEAQRRALQKEIQQLVIRLRKEGKSPAEVKAATKELKAKRGAVKQKKKEKKDKQRVWEEGAAKRRKEHLQRQHDLVIIPVVWRGRHDKLDVLKAAEDIKACLSQQGLDVWLDSRRHLTPGQKFAHWEHRGVLLRVEVGPDDLKAGVCQVCLAHTPGDYQSVEKKRVRLPPAGTRALLLRLKEWGVDLEIDRRSGDSEDEAEAEAVPRPTKGEAELLSDVQGNWSPREDRAKPGRKGKAKGRAKRGN